MLLAIVSVKNKAERDFVYSVVDLESGGRQLTRNLKSVDSQTESGRVDGWIP